MRVETQERILGVGLVAGIVAVMLLSTGCVSLRGLGLGGREIYAYAIDEGEISISMEAGGSNVPITDSLNPDVPLYFTKMPMEQLQKLLEDGMIPNIPNIPKPDPAEPAKPPVIDDPTDGSSGVPRNPEDTMPPSNVFLWKPVSENNHNLVVLLPTALTDEFYKDATVTVGGEFLSYAGINNGHRTHWRATKPGGEFPDGSEVVAIAASGLMKRWVIEDTSERSEVRYDPGS